MLSDTTQLILAYRPFIDPIDELFDAHRWWFFFLIPMAFLISIAYKAVRVADFKNYWRLVVSMALQIILAIIALGAASFVVIQFVIPRIVPMP